MTPPIHVFVDYDGTITDKDTLDYLACRVGSESAFQEIDDLLDQNKIELREALRRQLSLVRLSLDEADALLARELVFDPGFTDFVKLCEERDIEVTIVSSGIEELIRRALVRNRVSPVPIIANTVDDLSDGWAIHFRDDVPNGTDKAGVVRAAKAGGKQTIYIGDGRSDYDGALAADVRFARRGHSLERFLKNRRVEFVPFSSFAEIIAAMFG